MTTPETTQPSQTDSTPTPADATPEALPPRQALVRRWVEFIVERLIWLAGISTIIIVALIFYFLVREGLPAFLDIPLRQLLGSRWYPIQGMFGIWPLVVGSILVTVGAIFIAVPLGLTTAIYLGEIAPRWQRELLKPLIEVLAGIPSIVLGFLGWVALAPLVQQLGASTGLTAFTGSLILAYMALPTIISISEDALYAVPKEYRDGALAIGATQWQTIWRVVLPAGRSGLVIAVMLGIGRAIGETMAVMMVTGNAANIPAFGPGMFFEPVRTMTATIAAEMGEVAKGSQHYSVLFEIGIVLFLITFAINALAARLVGSHQTNRRRRGQL
jgi:phosphate transport system permease protein